MYTENVVAVERHCTRLHVLCIKYMSKRRNPYHRNTQEQWHKTLARAMYQKHIKSSTRTTLWALDLLREFSILPSREVEMRSQHNIVSSTVGCVGWWCCKNGKLVADDVYQSDYWKCENLKIWWFICACALNLCRALLSHLDSIVCSISRILCCVSNLITWTRITWIFVLSFAYRAHLHETFMRFNAVDGTSLHVNA